MKAAQDALDHHYSLFLATDRPRDIFSNCTLAHSLSADDTKAALESTCQSCNYMCKEGLIIDIHEQMEPATVCIVVLLGFVLTCCFFVGIIAYDKEGQTPRATAYLAYFFNFLGASTGLEPAILA